MQVGIGNHAATLKVYNANQPDLPFIKAKTPITPLGSGDIERINQINGNHWRKIFNCLAKVSNLIETPLNIPWQVFRDEKLLREKSNQAIIFAELSQTKKILQQHIDLTNQLPNSSNMPDCSQVPSQSKRPIEIHIICGKQFFNHLNLAVDYYWQDDAFAIAPKNNIIVSPYFDYRQLSNQKIESLVQLIQYLRSV
ncbi:DUF6942 family protein [Aliikangiella maris]|uniref:Uncharacterized protein n=2 Tax=Aliikangiella maris TaxID=3162458 RepID=A0ABV3MNI0_9GAMM